MKVDAHTQPIDPNKASATPEVEYKQCHDCLAKLPMGSFGLARYSKHGRSNICHDCRAQFQRLKRKERGAVSVVDDTQIRIVRIHNSALIDIGLSSTCEMAGFNVLTKTEYKVFFGKSGYLGLDCLCVFSTDGSMLAELAYSGAKDIKAKLLDFCKSWNIRLEMSLNDVAVSKATIYYL